MFEFAKLVLQLVGVLGIPLVRLCAKNKVEAQVLMGTICAQGLGAFAKAPEEAAEWFRRAAQHSDPTAESALGILYETGQGVPKDIAEALKWNRLGAEHGNSLAQRNLARFYLSGIGVPQDYAEAFRLCSQPHHRGDPKVQVTLGQLNENGLGTKQDLAEAALWYDRAAAQGDPGGLYNAGQLYELGRGVTKDSDRALRLFRRAAKAGSREGAFAAGRVYEHAKSYTSAERYYRQAARMNQPDAQFALALMCRDGLVEHKDSQEVIRLLQAAATSGHAAAQKELQSMNVSPVAP